MHYFFLQGSPDAIAEIKDAMRFDNLKDAKARDIADGNRAVIIMTEHEELQEGYPYAYHLAWYYTKDCGWQNFPDEQDAFERGQYQHRGYGKSLWDCEE